MSESSMGDRIAVARSAKGLSISQLARRMGIATKTLRNWETDRAEPRANKLQMLAGILNVPVVWLLAGGETSESVQADLHIEETASLSNKVERLIRMHEEMSRLLFEVSSEVRRIQRDIDEGGLNV